VAPNDRGFLAAALGPGMRAVTVPVSAKTGVGGFVFPGDRVDMMLTQTIEGNDDGQSLKTTETILRNLRVLATDQSTESTTTPDGKTIVRGVRTVTLEVTPRIAEKIEVAGTIGTLSLALRSIADNQSDLERAIASGEITLPDNASKEDEERVLQRAIARPQDGASSFVTGGDVSRFQRSAMPRMTSAGHSGGRRRGSRRTDRTDRAGDARQVDDSRTCGPRRGRTARPPGPGDRQSRPHPGPRHEHSSISSDEHGKRTQSEGQ
jgi:pilus assembly protein CpaB